MKSKTLAKVVMIYSIAFGAIALLGSVDADYVGSSGFAIVLSIAMITIAIIGLLQVGKKGPIEKPFMITLLVFYSLYQVSVLYLFILAIGYEINGLTELSLVAEALIIVPFIFTILYFTRLSDQAAVAETEAPASNPEKETFNGTIEARIQELKKLNHDGLITDEQYNDAVKKVLDKNI